MCKPHKRGLTNRWKAKDLAILKQPIEEES